MSLSQWSLSILNVHFDAQWREILTWNRSDANCGETTKTP
jgi:hypothetical protein